MQIAIFAHLVFCANVASVTSTSSQDSRLYSLPRYGEVAAVSKHAPDPLERGETKIVKPQLADSYLEEEDDDGRQFDGDESEGCAKSKSQAVEQDGAYHRLHDVAR